MLSRRSFLASLLAVLAAPLALPKPGVEAQAEAPGPALGSSMYSNMHTKPLSLENLQRAADEFDLLVARRGPLGGLR